MSTQARTGFGGPVPEVCQRHLLRTTSAGKFRLYCDRERGHEGQHELANGAKWSWEGMSE